MQNYMDGGEAIVEAFRRLDIDYVLASPGSEWGSVWEAFARQDKENNDGPVYLSCAHEMLVSAGRTPARPLSAGGQSSGQKRMSNGGSDGMRRSERRSSRSAWRPGQESPQILYN